MKEKEIDVQAPVCNTCGKVMKLNHQCIFHPEEGIVFVCDKCQLWDIRGCIRTAMQLNALTDKCFIGWKQSLAQAVKATLQ